MTELLITFIFIFVGIYGTVSYKKANEEALEKRKKLNRAIFGRELKVGKTTASISEYTTLLVSIVFLILGLFNLYRFIVNAN